MNSNIKDILEISGAKIIEYMQFSSGNLSRKKTRHDVNGDNSTQFHGLAICKYDNGSGVYLFYCDSNWNDITDTYHDNIISAKEQASFEFLDMENKWIKK